MATGHGIRRERLRIGDFSLYYERVGAGPALVFLHGMGGNHLSWWQQVPYFMRWYECITVDQRGFGLSPDPENRFNDAHADDLNALLDHLKIEKAVLVGQSMGGWTIVGAALKRPERVAAMVMAGTFGGIYARAMDKHFLGRHAIALTAEPAIGAMPTYAEDYFARRPEMAFLYDDIRGLGAQPPADAFARLGVMRYDVAEAKEKLRMPVLCIVGEEDVLIPPGVVREVAAVLSNSRVVTVPDCGHSTYFEQPAVFNQAIRDFLRSIDFEQA